jgi:hypothetical protein
VEPCEYTNAREAREYFSAKGAITGWQIVVPHYPERFRGVIVPWRKGN